MRTTSGRPADGGLGRRTTGAGQPHGTPRTVSYRAAVHATRG
ncbi:MULTISPECIES: hypothetical protein [Streptomyces]|nr:MULTISPECIES: hypothetical protein [Streptomyces]